MNNTNSRLPQDDFVKGPTMSIATNSSSSFAGINLRCLLCRRGYLPWGMFDSALRPGRLCLPYEDRNTTSNVCHIFFARRGVPLSRGGEPGIGLSAEMILAPHLNSAVHR